MAGRREGAPAESAWRTVPVVVVCVRACVRVWMGRPGRLVWQRDGEAKRHGAHLDALRDDKERNKDQEQAVDETTEDLRTPIPAPHRTGAWSAHGHAPCGMNGAPAHPYEKKEKAGGRMDGAHPYENRSFGGFLA